MNEIEEMYFKGIYEYLEKKPILNVFYRNGYGIVERNKSENVISLQFKFHSDDVENFEFDGIGSIQFDFDTENIIDFMKRSEWSICSGGVISATSNFKGIVGSYSPDFVLSLGIHDFVIEIDGHNFHEKTKEQVKQDNTKNRDYLKWGVVPIRFSGSEVYNNPLKCAEETFETVLQHCLHTWENECGFVDNVIIPQYTNHVLDYVENYCKNEVPQNV